VPGFFVPPLPAAVQVACETRNVVINKSAAMAVKFRAEVGTWLLFVVI
jgi:hypothetical protein